MISNSNTPGTTKKNAFRALLASNNADFQNHFLTIKDFTDNQNPITLTSDNCIVWDVSKSINAELTLTQDCCLALMNLTPGDSGILRIVQGGTGNYKLGIPSNSEVANNGLGAINLSPAVGAVDIVSFRYNGNIISWSVSNNFTKKP